MVQTVHSMNYGQVGEEVGTGSRRGPCRGGALNRENGGAGPAMAEAWLDSHPPLFSCSPVRVSPSATSSPAAPPAINLKRNMKLTKTFSAGDLAASPSASPIIEQRDTFFNNFVRFFLVATLR